MKIARIYIRVSTDEQELERQSHLVKMAQTQGYYVAKVYAEKASGTLAERPALTEMICDLQPGDVVIAEHIDRISRLPLPEAEKLIQRIKEKGAVLSIPGILDLSQIDVDTEIGRIVLDAIQSLLLRIALQNAREDYETRRKRQAAGILVAQAKNKYKGRTPDYDMHRKIFALRKSGSTIEDTAAVAGCGRAQVSRVMRMYRSISDIPKKP